MITTRVILQPSFILHSRPYRETSLLVELLTVECGRLTVLARGVRNQRSRLQGLLVPFLPLLVSYSGKTELQNLVQVEVEYPGYSVSGKVLLIGFYLNELLVRLLPRHDPHPNIYHAYKRTLISMVNSERPEIELRLFEKCLLADLGYGLQLNCTTNGEFVISEEEYIFEFGVGLKRAKIKSVANYIGQSLLALHEGMLNTQEELRDAKRLLRSALSMLLGNRPLKSRELFI